MLLRQLTLKKKKREERRLRKRSMPREKGKLKSSHLSQRATGSERKESRSTLRSKRSAAKKTQRACSSRFRKKGKKRSCQLLHLNLPHTLECGDREKRGRKSSTAARSGRRGKNKKKEGAPCKGVFSSRGRRTKKEKTLHQKKKGRAAFN